MEWRLELKGCLVMMGDGVDVDVDDGEGEGDDGGSWREMQRGCRRKDAKKPTVEMRLTSAEAYVAPSSFPPSKITRIPGFDIPLAEHGYIEHVSGAYGGTHWRNFCSSRDIAPEPPVHVAEEKVGFVAGSPGKSSCWTAHSARIGS
ncbi:ribonuclease Z [Coccidioides immitis RS]|uniref:Ribonuclease Z n=1 Tax=Coccidioides immitis (strain RS) TaxID=246410 RepID=A0A0D8JVV0_COCIM|nr:ribonuclease Z [Coccidioides immitis RS]KJF61437.1 ribonuclease Z [Coccidioides immitis RS]